MEEDKSRIEAVIHGRVQGVFFRQSTLKAAQKLGLKGFVRNKEDGTVHVVAEGPKYRLKELLAFCRQGPDSASVDKVEHDWQEPSHHYETFSIMY